MGVQAAKANKLKKWGGEITVKISTLKLRLRTLFKTLNKQRNNCIAQITKKNFRVSHNKSIHLTTSLNAFLLE